MADGQKASLRKVGLGFGLISGTEWLIIIGGFMGTFLMLFYQTSIGTLATAFGMNSFEVGVGFALFMLAFAASAFLMHRFKLSQLRLVEIISLVLLGSTMPLYAIIKGVGPAYTLMTLDGFIVGVMIDSFMTMAGMASLDPSRRQVEQAGFAFWPALAPIIAPLITGMLLKLGIIEIFTFFSIMAFVAIPFVLVLRGKYALQYVERKTEKTEERGSISSLFKNRQFNWAFVAALGFTIPYYLLMSFGVRYGPSIGFSPSQVFYLFTLMFTSNLLTRFYIMIKSPIQNKYPYMLAALSFATLAAVFLYASHYAPALYYLAFVFAGIPYGTVWPLGLQIANTTFKSGQIATATSFFSSSMMIMSVIMPVVGIMASVRGVGFVGSFLILAVLTFAFFLTELVLRPRIPEGKAIP